MMKGMKPGVLKQFVAAVASMVLFALLAVPAAWAGNLLDEMKVENTCGTTYADKLASCTPFRCTRPSPMAMMFGFPSEDELKKMPPEQQQKMRSYMVAAEKKLKAMSLKERGAYKAKMVSTLEIKGFDGQGRCQTRSGGEDLRLECALDAEQLQKVADFARDEDPNHVVIDTESNNPLQQAMNNGQCRTMVKDAELGWVSMNKMNHMSHFEISLSEHGKHVDGHIKILNAADGKVLFDKDINTSYSTRKINLNPGTFDVEVTSKNKQLQPIWFRGVKLGEANVFKKDVEFHAISGTLKLTLNVNSQPQNMAVYMTDPESHQWIYLKAPIFGKEPNFYFKSATIKLPETLTGKYEVFVTPVTQGFKPSKNAEYQKFLLSIKNGEAVEKTMNFGQAAVEATANNKATSKPSAIASKPKFPVTDANGMEQDTDRPGGGDIRSLVIADNDPTACQKACRDDARCKAWTYVKPNMGQGPQGNCWLKADVPVAVKNSCCISGVK